MRPLDLLDQFDRAPSKIAFIATYEFNAQFFERRLLAKRTFGSAERVVVFMDQGRYHDLISAGLTVSGFNRRYLVVPVDRGTYVFHPKLYLALSDNRADAVIGSNNCTNAGTAYNIEICSAFSVSADKAEPSDGNARSVIRQVFDVLREFAAGSGVFRGLIEKEFLVPAEKCVPWLDPKVVLPRGDVELVHSHQRPLWAQLQKRLQELTVRKITILAPFFDSDLGFLKKLRSQWPDAPLAVIAQEHYATLPGRKLSKLLAKPKDCLFAAEIKPGRRLHAKAYAFETNKGTYWITGSANATSPAFEGRNTEAVILFRTKEGPDAILDDGPFKLKKMVPDKFIPGTEKEPRNENPRAACLALEAALLGPEGTLSLQARGFESFRRISLRVRNFNETTPVFSLWVKFDDKGHSPTSLDENQMAQLRGAVLCQLKGVNSSGHDEVSNEVAIAQLHQILKERGGHAGPRNALQTITETGENLVPYVDSLGSVREAVEFFNHCSIRFFDGETSGRGFRQETWKQRDPFKPDTPPTWANVPAGGTAEDLRRAIWDFVERHQWEKLNKHVRRGNLNGLPNFLDIFRTLNGLLLTYHARSIGGGGPIVPFPFVTHGIMINLELLIGPFEDGEADWYDGHGFVASIIDNMPADRKLVLDRLKEERVPQMLRAAVEAMVDCRAQARKLGVLDAWSLSRLRWVAAWIKAQGFDEPSADDVRAAGMEYSSEGQAA